MGSIVFWILFWLLILTLIVSNTLHERNRKIAVRNRIKDSFGSKDGDTYPADRFDKRPSLFDHMISKEKDAFYIDDITVNDLGLRDIYSRMNSCVTCAGSDYLYCGFRIKPEFSYELIKNFINDRDKACDLAYILAHHRIRSDDDAFDLLMKLSKARGGSPVSDIMVVAGIIASAVLSAFYPVAGIIGVIAFILISMTTYFSGKRSMDDNLKGLAIAVRMMECSQKLSEAGCDGFDKYGDLVKLRRGKGLISYREQSTSDPFSIILDYVRMITHIDLIYYKIRISMIRERTGELLELYNDIGKLDAGIALASFLYPREHCEAVIFDECSISAKHIYHPLLTDPVGNDIVTKKSILITGSNASGKSTFLKAVGINVLFAQHFGFAFAEEFATYDFRLYSSMALSDNILGGESYYVVEARSIKRICDAAASGRCLCIIDEVLRGTNTVERIAASTEILRSLCRPSVICLAATHDLELANLLENDMDCYYFTEEITDDDVRFTFAINRGVSDKTNAIRLLTMLGFERNVTDSAKALAEQYRKTGSWVKSR